MNVFITGVSSGIGNGLARAYLQRGYRVFGCSRRSPDELLAQKDFRFAQLDVTDEAEVPLTLTRLLADVDSLDLVILNAGILGPFGDLATIPLEQCRRVMEVNVWSNKTVLDALFSSHQTVRQVVTVSSGAAVNGNRGWAGYAISKAALNMLTRLYAEERPETHFCALAPGIVDTAMQDILCAVPEVDRYPSLATLRAKRSTAEMPDPDGAAVSLVAAIERLPRIVTSGDYADVRRLSE